MASTDVQYDERLLVQLLKPSYLNATLSLLLAVVVMGAAAVSKLTSSHGWLPDMLKTVSASNHHLLQLHQGDGGDKLSLVLLFVFWACVGLVVYFIVMGVGRGVAEVGQIQRELDYVNTSRRSIVLGVFGHLAVRIIGIIGLFIAFAILLKFAVPYAVSAVQASTLQFSSALAIILGVVVLLATTHLIVIMARLIVLRPRLFTATI